MLPLPTTRDNRSPPPNTDEHSLHHARAPSFSLTGQPTSKQMLPPLSLAPLSGSPGVLPKKLPPLSRVPGTLPLARSFEHPPDQQGQPDPPPEGSSQVFARSQKSLVNLSTRTLFQSESTGNLLSKLSNRRGTGDPRANHGHQDVEKRARKPKRNKVAPVPERMSLKLPQLQGNATQETQSQGMSFLWRLILGHCTTYSTAH